MLQRKGCEYPSAQPTNFGGSDNYTGVRQVDLASGYTVEIFSGMSYIRNKARLIDIATELEAVVFKRDPDLSRQMMTRNMRVGEKTRDIEVPSVMLFRRKETSEDAYIGFSTQRIFVIRTSDTQKDVPLLYISTRAFKEGHRGLHLGRFAIQQAQVVHREATWLGHRTQSPAAARSVQESGVFMEGRLYPWDALYSTDHLAQQIMVELFMNVRINGSGVNWLTGVSIADYLESNGAYVPNPNHAPTMEIKRIMKEELKMKCRRGDSLYIVGQLR